MAVSDLLYQIHHLHISHNATYLPPRILHNLCFSFLLGSTAVPREIENNAYAKFWGANKWEMYKNTADTPTKVIGFILNDIDVIYGEAG